MQLTTEILQRYEGGELEIQNSSEHYIYRGEVDRAWVEGTDLRVRFKWLAKADEDFKWHSQDNLDYAVSLEVTSVSQIGFDRIHYSVMFIGESGTFFPPEGSKLDPSKVIGLQLAS